MKTIWLVNAYAVSPEYETRLRTIKTAQYLIQMGYKVVIFGGSFIHNTNINYINDKKKYIEREYNGLNFVHIRTSAYAGNGLKRFKNLIQFHAGFKRTAKKFGKPDYIIHDLAIPFGANIYKTARKLKAKYVGQIQDLWPESFVAFGLIKRDGIIHKILKKIELRAYQKADELIFSMEGGRDYILRQWWNKLDISKVHYLNNGVDLADFAANLKEYSLYDADLENEDTFKVVYIGSIRLANDLKKLIEAAELLRENERIKFIIFGDGDKRKELMDYVLERNLSNVLFKAPKIGIEYVPYVVSHSDLNILNYMPNSIWQYGGSQSKFFQYLAAGKPILSNLQLGYCMIDKYNCGIAKSFSDSGEYKDAILYFVGLKDAEYADLCKNAKNAAAEYDYKYLTGKLVKMLGLE
jgi:glycosyltransferase involved in cell wall biosynthesis